VLSGYDHQAVALYLGGEYYCLKCAGKKLGELRVQRIALGLAPPPGDPDAWDPDGLVHRYEVEEKLAEIAAIKVEGHRAHKAIDWDAVNAEEWGTRCDQCGDELAPPEPHEADTERMTGGVCRHCWADVSDPIHRSAA
jgi:hypothetical protein